MSAVCTGIYVLLGRHVPSDLGSTRSSRGLFVGMNACLHELAHLQPTFLLLRAGAEERKVPAAEFT